MRMPDGLDATGAMVLGAAGLTAMLACMALERNGASPEILGELPVLVTGAAGGVGSTAGSRCWRGIGYRVLASTGRAEESDYLVSLGASEAIGRDALTASKGPLAPVQFGAAIDVVGGSTLAEVIQRTAPNGTVAACRSRGWR